MISFDLRDRARRFRSKLTFFGELRVLDGGIPPYGDVVDRLKPFRQYFTSDGAPPALPIAAAGTQDMLVDGDPDAVEFWIPAAQDVDRFITRISFALAGDAADLSSFVSAGQGVLSNGTSVFYESLRGVVTLHDGMVDNLDVIRLSGAQPAFGDGATAFQVPGLGPPPAKANGYLPTLDLQDVFDMPWGINLRAGTQQRLVIRVQDDLTHADNEQFDAIAYGFDRYPE